MKRKMSPNAPEKAKKLSQKSESNKEVVSALSWLKEEISFRKQEAVDILRHRFTDEQIKHLCIKFSKALETTDLFQELTSEHYPPETFYATAALCSLMYLEVNIPPSSNYTLPAEHAANLILTGFNAMLSLGRGRMETC